MQIIYLVKAYYADYKKNYYNTKMKRQPNYKMGERFEKIFPQIGYTNGQ